MNTQNTSQKSFDELKNIGLISVVRYDKNNMPEVLFGNFIKKISEKTFEKRFFTKKIIDNPEVPTEVLEFFRSCEKQIFSFNGVVYKKFTDSESQEIYFDCYEDLTKTLNGVLDLPEISKILIMLENSVGKLIRTSDWTSLPGFKVLITEFGEVHVEFAEDKLVGHNLRECKVVLYSNNNGSSFTQDLGFLTYFVYRR